MCNQGGTCTPGCSGDTVSYLHEAVKRPPIGTLGRSPLIRGEAWRPHEDTCALAGLEPH